jgi:hypothetical protein
MAQRFSISTKQAVLAGLGLAAIATGVIITLSASKKKKKQLQNKAEQTTTKKSIMV